MEAGATAGQVGWQREAALSARPQCWPDLRPGRTAFMCSCVTYLTPARFLRPHGLYLTPAAAHTAQDLVSDLLNATMLVHP